MPKETAGTITAQQHPAQKQREKTMDQSAGVWTEILYPKWQRPAKRKRSQPPGAKPPPLQMGHIFAVQLQEGWLTGDQRRQSRKPSHFAIRQQCRLLAGHDGRNRRPFRRILRADGIRTLRSAGDFSAGNRTAGQINDSVEANHQTKNAGNLAGHSSGAAGAPQEGMENHIANYRFGTQESKRKKSQREFRQPFDVQNHPVHPVNPVKKPKMLRQLIMFSTGFTGFS
jgi:hypothetical protein